MSTVLGDIITLGGGGGSGGEIYALISVTYPSGSTCTATNGTTTLTAANTSGKVMFAIPEPASTPETWTVTCVNGENSVSETVSITAKYQISEIEISFTISFTVAGNDTITYLADNEMTWAQWVGSQYNTDGYYIDTSNNIVRVVVGSKACYICKYHEYSTPVSPSATIINGQAYMIDWGPL